MTVHVIGAGMAGLAAALTAAAAGAGVNLIEAAPQAGGRCRSFDDPVLGCRIDNGSHVLIGANPAALAFLDQVGARDSLMPLGLQGVPFVDLETGERWRFRAGRPVPGAGLYDHLQALRLAGPTTGRTVSEVLADGTLMRRFWEPLTVAALNTAPERASAALLRRIVGEILRRGSAGLELFMARQGLSESFVDPALRCLQGLGAAVRFGCPVQGLLLNGATVAGLALADGEMHIGAGERVILALPPAAARRLLPHLPIPSGSNAIVNAHFRVPQGLLAGDAPELTGICGGTAQWLFRRGVVLSVTVSDANRLLECEQAELAALLWQEVCRALSLPPCPLPPSRIVREKRATFDQTPGNEGLRPPARTSLSNLFLAGDWTATGLPATIEGAIRSGRRAAELALRA